jgi:uncharacterized repeat protein (TIGR03943 family)
MVVAVNRDLQAAVLLMLGGVTLRLSFTDMFLNYVREPMRPLLLISGAALVILGLTSLISSETQPANRQAGLDHGHDHAKVPLVAWLLMLPVLAVFLIAPPPLGAEAAANDTGVQELPNSEEALFDPLPAEQPARLRLDDYAARALYDEGKTLTDRSVELKGFVTEKKGGGWYLTRFASSCCAADAIAIKVEIPNLPAPPEGEWVNIIGTYVPQPETNNTERVRPPLLEATSITPTTQPRNTYL